MKKFETGTIKYLICLIVLTAIFGYILYPFFDFIACKVFTKTAFVYSVSKHIVQPSIFAVIYGVTYWIFDKKRK